MLTGARLDIGDCRSRGGFQPARALNTLKVIPTCRDWISSRFMAKRDPSLLSEHDRYRRN